MAKQQFTETSALEPNMEKNNTPNRHDAFFKTLMEKSANAAEFISGFLPEVILETLNLTTLQKTDSSFIDGWLNNYRADVVFECMTGSGEEVKVALLLEHKSHEEKYPHFQLLTYMLRIWFNDIRNGREPKDIVPVLFYHGQKKWTYRPFKEYFKAAKHHPALRTYQPSFDFVFVNLQEKDDDWISERIHDLGLRISLLLMKEIGSPDLFAKLESIFEGYEILEETEEGRGQLREIFLYLNIEVNKSEERIQEAMNHETFMRIMPIPEGSPMWRKMQMKIEEQLEQGKAKLEEEKKQLEEEFKQLEEEFKQLEEEKKQLREEAKAEGMEEGMAQGMTQGMAQGKAEGIEAVAKSMLEAGMEMDQVAKFTGLSLARVEELRNSIA